MRCLPDKRRRASSSHRHHPAQVIGIRGIGDRLRVEQVIGFAWNR